MSYLDSSKIFKNQGESQKPEVRHKTYLTGPANPDLWQHELFLTVVHLKARPYVDFKTGVHTLFSIVLYHVYLWPEHMDARREFPHVSRTELVTAILEAAMFKVKHST